MKMFSEVNKFLKKLAYPDTIISLSDLKYRIALCVRYILMHALKSTIKHAALWFQIVADNIGHHTDHVLSSLDVVFVINYFWFRNISHHLFNTLPLFHYLMMNSFFSSRFGNVSFNLGHLVWFELSIVCRKWTKRNIEIFRTAEAASPKLNFIWCYVWCYVVMFYQHTLQNRFFFSLHFLFNSLLSF